MTTYIFDKEVKTISGIKRIFCNGEEIPNVGTFNDGEHEDDGEGWVDFVRIDEDGFWEQIDGHAIIRRMYGAITWEPIE